MIYNFYIEDLYTRTQIVEPRNWKDLESVFERDFDTHGVFFDYTDGTLKLGFSCEARDLLEAAFQSYGIDAYYVFVVTEQKSEYDTEIEIFNGQIDFSTRHIDTEYFDVEVNSSNTQLKFKARKSIEINLNANKDLDGNDLNNVNYDDSIRNLGLKPLGQLILTMVEEQAAGVQSSGGHTYYTVGLQNQLSTELQRFKPKKNQGYQGNILGDIVSFDINSVSFLELDEDAELQISIDWDIDATFTNVSGTPGTYALRLALLIDQGYVTDTIDSTVVSTNISGSDTVYWSLKAGTKLALLVRAFSSNTSEVLDTTVTINQLDMTITNVISKPGELTQWYRFHDALNKNLSFITGYKDFLYSDLLGSTVNGYPSDGCFANTYLTNGFRIRGINTDKKAPSFSFDNFFNTLNALHAIGYGFEDRESPTELGYFDVQWIDLIAGIATIRITINLTSDITVNSNLGFYDNETLYGVYNVDAVSWNGSYTEIDLDVSVNTNYHDDVYGMFPSANTYNCFLTCDSNTVVRERLRVEEWEHFYGDNELLDLGVVEDYEEDPLTDIYNEIKFEFKKYANDEKKPKTLEDFSTRASWAIPIERTDKKKSLTIDFVGSSGLINEAQSVLSTEKPTTGNKLDDDIFFCDKVSKQITATVDFDNSGYISMPDYVYLNYIYGVDKFTVSGSSLNDGIFHIDLSQEPVFSVVNEAYLVYVVESITSDAADSATFTPIFDGQTEYKPETQENMTSVTGLEEPEFTYNIRRTIKRMLLRWGGFIRSLVSYTQGIGLLKNLTYVYNGDLTTQLDTTNLTGCYIDSGIVTENDNVDVSSLESPKFKPNIIKFTKVTCDSDYNLILSAHKNSDIYNRNYGYLTFTNNLGETKTGWLMTLRRSPIDRITKYEVIERYV